MRGGAQRTVNVYIDGNQLQINTLSELDELDEIHVHTFVDTLLGLADDISVVISGSSYTVDDTKIPVTFIGRHDVTKSIKFTDKDRDQLIIPFENLVMKEDGSLKKVELEII